MPISVKTMRDIWDEKRIETEGKKEIIGKRVVISEKVRGAYLNYLEAREKSLAEIGRNLEDYLERKKYATEIFGFIERDLRDAGFSKI